MSNYQPMIAWAARQFGVDPGLLIEMARLESTFRPGATNPGYTAPDGSNPTGMFQYIQSTWDSFSRQARAANPELFRGVRMDRTDPKAAALVTAWAVKNGNGKHWEVWDRAQAKRGTYKGPLSSGGGAAAHAPAMPASGQARPMGLMMEPATKFGSLWAKGGKANKLGAAVDSSRQRRTAAYNMMRPIPDAVQEPAQSAPQGQASGAGGGGVNIAKLPRKDGESDWQYIQRLGSSLFGLQNDPGNAQTTGGRHTDGSEHYEGRAVDFGDARNSRAKLNAWKAWARRMGFDVLDEGDHIHVSMPGGGT